MLAGPGVKSWSSSIWYQLSAVPVKQWHFGHLEIHGKSFIGQAFIGWYYNCLINACKFRDIVHAFGDEEDQKTEIKQMT